MNARWTLLLIGLVLPAPWARAAEADTPEPSAPVVTTTVAPVHPPKLMEARIGGEAEIECLVTEEGKVGEAKVLSATRPEFGEAALEAVRQWEFKPAERDGRPVAMRVTIPFNFQVPSGDPIEAFAKRKVFMEIEGEVVPAEQMPAWPMPKHLLVPNYPSELRGSGKRGKAVVSVVINREGKVMNPRLVKATFPEFERPAMAAAVSLEFPPQLGPDKKPVNVSMDLQFDFRDEGRAPKPKPEGDVKEPARKAKQ